MPRIPWTRRFTTQGTLLLSLVWATDRLLDSVTLGAGAALLLGLAALAIPLRALPPRLASPAVVVALAYTLAAAGAVAVTGSVFGLLAASGGLVLVSMAVRWNRLPSLVSLCLGSLNSSDLVVGSGIHDVITLIRLKQHGRRGWSVVSAALPWLVPLAGGAVFLGLFMLANPLIAHLLSRAWDWLSQDGWPSLRRVVLWLSAAWCGWMLLRGRWRCWQAHHSVALPVVDQRPVAIRCLLIFNLVFLLHNCLDAAYLWGGRALPAGMTYATYAHRGSHTLLVTALLAAAIMLVWFRPRSPVERSRPARVLVFIWLAQNVLVVLGAADRLWRYVEVYGLTRWRLSAGIWMALVVIGLLLIGWRILRSWDNAWLVDANLSVLAVMLLVLGWSDADGLIAWQNVRHLGPRPPPLCTCDRDPDIEYLHSLGPSAIPALDWLGRQHPATASAQAARQEVIRLLSQLHAQSRDWRSRTLRSQAWLHAYPTR